MLSTNCRITKRNIEEHYFEATQENKFSRRWISRSRIAVKSIKLFNFRRMYTYSAYLGICFLPSEMLKWTVSRSLSASSSTPHGPPNLNKAPRRPFRDLSNTPPAAGTKARGIPGQNVENISARTTPVRRRRCRSHGSDMRAYFQVFSFDFSCFIFFQ